MRNRRGPVVVAGLGLVALLMAPEIAWTQEATIRKLVGEDYDKAEKAGDVSAKMRLYTADAVPHGRGGRSDPLPGPVWGPGCYR